MTPSPAAPRRRSTVPTVLTATWLALAGAAPAVASHGDEGYQPDDYRQGVEGFTLTGNGRAAMTWGDSQLERSDISTFAGGYDIEVYDYIYANTGWYGATDCQDWVIIFGACDLMRIRLNESAMAGLGTSYWESLGCHEFGHTGDLGHRFSNSDADNNSCMRSDVWPRSYDTHDMNELNAQV